MGISSHKPGPAFCTSTRGVGRGRFALATVPFALAPSAVAAEPDKSSKETDPDKSAQRAAEKPAAGVELQRVVLFNSGVGFFDRQGNVRATPEIELKFNVDDINDLLKSMVLEDLGGGHISAVTYGSKDPITKTLKTFAIDLTSNPTLGQILNQIRGERIEIDAAQSDRRRASWASKPSKKQVGKRRETVDVDMLNLLTDAGLRSVPLDSVGTDPLAQRKARQGISPGARRCWPWATTPTRKASRSTSWATASGRCASATSSKRRSGKPAIGWCSTTTGRPLAARLGDRRKHDRRRLEQRRA